MKLTSHHTRIAVVHYDAINKIENTTENHDAAKLAAGNMGLEHAIESESTHAQEILHDMWGALMDGGHSEDRARRMVLEEFNSWLDVAEVPEV